MDRAIAKARGALVPVVVIAIATWAVEFFLRDLGVEALRSWGAATAVVLGLGSALGTLSQDSWARALIWFLVLPVGGFLVAYDLLDAAFEPFMDADWPVALIAFLVVLSVETLLLTASIEDD